MEEEGDNQSTLRASDPQVGNLCLAASVRLGQQEPGEFEALDRQVRELVQERFGPYLDRIVLSVSSYWLFPWVEGELATEHRVNLRAYEDLEEHVQFVAGEWPTEALPAVLSSLLKAIVEQTGITVVIASHDTNVRAVADWVYELRDGRLVGWRRQ